MRIWYVDCQDLSCAWTKKEDAINYFKKLVKECDWIIQSKEGDEEDPDAFVCYKIFSHGFLKSLESHFNVCIHPGFLDELPYWKN